MLFVLETVHIDLLKFVDTAYSQYMQSETLSLNEVSREFLGDTKKEFEFKLPEEKIAEETGGEGWQTLAKQQGFEIEKDDFETYQTGVEAHYKSKYQVDLGKYQPGLRERLSGCSGD